MDGSHLHRTAKILHESSLARAYLAAASSNEDLPTASACPECFKLWIPGVTCRVRLVRLSGNKRARSRQRGRIEAYLEQVAKRKPDFVKKKIQKLRYTCWSCGTETDFPHAVLTKTVNPKPATKDRGKKRKAASAPAAATPKAGLSLSDFLL